MACECVVCSHLYLVFPGTGVASLRPRLGGEPPWFHNFCFFIAGLSSKSWKLGVSCCPPTPLERELYCFVLEWRNKLHLDYEIILCCENVVVGK